MPNPIPNSERPKAELGQGTNYELPYMFILKFRRESYGGLAGASGANARFTPLKHRTVAQNGPWSLSGHFGATWLPRMTSERSKEAARPPSGPPMCSKVALGAATEPPWASKEVLETTSETPVHSKMLPRPAAEPPKHAKAWPQPASQREKLLNQASWPLCDRM